MSKKNPLATVLEIPVQEALYLARAGVAAASKDDITPVITGVQLSAENDVVKVLATDRYRVHRATVTVEGAGTFEPVNIAGSAWRWLVSNANFFGRGILQPVVKFDIIRDEAATETAHGLRLAGGQATFTVHESDADEADFVGYRSSLIAGMFPARVENLLDQAFEQESDATDSGTVDLDLLAGCRALASYRGEKPRIRFVPSAGSQKTGQVLVAYKNGAALIQKGTEV
jgi:hypothetical protein